jgi:hypothetical protein
VDYTEKQIIRNNITIRYANPEKVEGKEYVCMPCGNRFYKMAVVEYHIGDTYHSTWICKKCLREILGWFKND